MSHQSFSALSRTWIIWVSATVFFLVCSTLSWPWRQTPFHFLTPSIPFLFFSVLVHSVPDCSRLCMTPSWHHTVRYMTHSDVLWHHYLWRRMTHNDSHYWVLFTISCTSSTISILVVAVVRLQSWLRLYLAIQGSCFPLNFCLYLAVEASLNPPELTDYFEPPA